ncbi:MAG: T9SS type A sorting domain-containing protein, partial [Flavobacteriales bacterium]|nr:T9SS type A sorting domain-containing protein [Flavobacteriales bacterium]
YPITVSGTTDGNFTNYFTAFFDWDQNGVFEASQQIGFITNTACVATATNNVTVPVGALNGTTRMRIVKDYVAGAAQAPPSANYPSNPCGTYDFGQAEDYTLSVTGGVAPFSYAWDNAGTLNDATIANPIATPSVTTTYQVTVTAGNGCTAIGSVGVTMDPTDTDSDGITDCLDDCPTTPGVIGGPCNDGNPFTTGDVLNGSCVCAGTPVPCDNWTLSFDTDANGSDITWQIVDATSPFVLASGGPLGNNSTVNTTVCVPQGACFRLTVNDAGNNGLNGGWRIIDNNGRLIVDNSDNGSCFTGSTTTGDPWCNQPASAQTLIAAHCGRLNWLPTDVIIASANAAVSAQWGIGNQTDDGYQFWFEDPCGSYTRRILRTHAVSGGNGPADAIRATKLKINSMVTLPIPANTLLNVRVRTLVNGSFGTWGPACQFMVNPTACTITQLNNVVASPNYSCGVTGKSVGASGNAGKIFANVVTSGGNPATNYRFEISLLAEGYTRNAVSNTAVLQLAAWQTLPLLCGTYTYDVRVQASFDGGTTYCPYGPVCTVEITNNSQFCTAPGAIVGGGDRSASFDQATFAMYPNPNNGGELFFNMSKLDASVNTVSLDIFDTFGKRAMTATLPVQDGLVSDVIELGSHMAAGLYMVNITAGTTVTTERLVIQR